MATAGPEHAVTDALRRGDTDGACPYLGLVTDPATHFTFPSSAQSCHSERRPIPLATAKQARDCLTAQHVSCPRYRPPGAPAPRDEVRAIVAEAVATQGPRPKGSAAAGRPTPRLSGVAILLGLFGGSIVLGLLFGSWLAGGTGGSPQATLIASPSNPATGTPTVTSSPTTASPSATPARSAAPSTSPSPSGPLIHVVQRNETLTLIAARYGITAKAIQDANKIADPNQIFVGDRLIIPLP